MTTYRRNMINRARRVVAAIRRNVAAYYRHKNIDTFHARQRRLWSVAEVTETLTALTSAVMRGDETEVESYSLGARVR